MLSDLEVEEEVKLRAVELGKPTPVPSNHFDATKHVRLVPPFNEDEVEKFFSHFEKVATSLKWPRGVWTILVQSVLRGKAQKIYSSLSLDNSTDYDAVKKAVLKAYEPVPEAYRQKFRNTKKTDIQSHVEFGRDKENLFDKWCQSKDIGSEFDKLRQLILIEEFKRCVPNDIKSYIDEQNVKSMQEAAV